MLWHENPAMNKPAENILTKPSGQQPWDRIAGSEEFKHLLKAKKLFMVPAFVFFFANYFGLAALVGYAPKLAATRAIGTVTVAYVYALSQFAVGWIVAGLYVIAAARFDAIAKDILDGAKIDTAKNRDERQGDN
jgi:uncharacterized membrane protein (DUF485 family)